MAQGNGAEPQQGGQGEPPVDLVVQVFRQQGGELLLFAEKRGAGGVADIGGQHRREGQHQRQDDPGKIAGKPQGSAPQIFRQPGA